MLVIEYVASARKKVRVIPHGFRKIFAASNNKTLFCNKIQFDFSAAHIVGNIIFATKLNMMIILKVYTHLKKVYTYLKKVYICLKNFYNSGN